jgi:hypothetical protein
MFLAGNNLPQAHSEPSLAQQVEDFVMVMVGGWWLAVQFELGGGKRNGFAVSRIEGVCIVLGWVLDCFGKDGNNVRSRCLFIDSL